MANRSKSGWKRNRHIVKQRAKRRFKRQKAALLAAGYIQKGKAPVAAVPAA